MALRRGARSGAGLVPVVASMLVVLVALSGCSQLRARTDGSQVEPDALHVPVSQPILDTIEVGVLDGLVSILVRNPTDQVLVVRARWPRRCRCRCSR